MSNTATPLLPTPAANCTAGASQPADASAGTGGAAQPADGTVGTGGVAQPSVSTPGMIGVAQSAQDLPARLWKQTPFFTQHLAAGSRNFMLAAKADTAREALNLAYQHDAWLPLTDSDLCNGSLKEWLNITDALFVTAERIPKVFDHNRWQIRVDVFAYMPLGAVIRYHSGKQSKTMHSRIECQVIHSCSNSLSPQQQALAVHCMPSHPGSSLLQVLLSPAPMQSHRLISPSSACMMCKHAAAESFSLTSAKFLTANPAWTSTSPEEARFHGGLLSQQLLPAAMRSKTASSRYTSPHRIRSQS